MQSMTVENTKSIIQEALYETTDRKLFISISRAEVTFGRTYP